MFIIRELSEVIEKWLFRKKIIIIYGARQVGKTTLVKEILKNHNGEYYNCEIIRVNQALEKKDPYSIKDFIGVGKLVVFDEAQKVNDIGLSLKLLIDTYPDLQIIATGSSSFELANKINEPLTGRALEFHLNTFSIMELKNIYNSVEFGSQLERFLVYGCYPDIVNNPGDEKLLLDNLAGKYLYQDILSFENLKRSDLIVKLLQLLALQIGNEVSINELAVNLQTSRDTIERYLNLLEKTFVIFRLKALSRNSRSEISKKSKIYFWDNGIRNSLIAAYQPINQRNDIGALWENFCITERIKNLNNKNLKDRRYYFWRNHLQKEVDYIEEYNGRFYGYEFKWNKNKCQTFKDFLEAYPDSEIKTINRENFLEFVSI